MIKDNIKSLYEVFSERDKIDIDNAVASLNEEDKALLYKRFGNNLNNSNIDELSDEEKSKLYGIVYGKIRRRLSSRTKYQNIPIKPLKTVNKNTVKKNNTSSFKMVEIKDDNIDNNELLIKEACIFAIHAGYVNNKKYSVGEIANFFNMDELEVIDILRKGYNLSKNNLNNMLNQVIDNGITKVKR